ncbi:MAG TPA: DNA polymerase III subunit delta [Dehalococcoidia bacterium]|nr:DNA polymerase III subunit delta [Dehalococcoidia bacterium]
MLYVLYGQDGFRAREELAAIRTKLDRDGNLAHNTERLEGKGLSPGELRSACHTASFFAEDRLVVVEGLMGRLGGARRRGRRGARAPADAGGGGSSDFDQFVEVLTNLPESTTVVLLDENAPTGFLEAIAGQATVKQFAILRQEQLRTWAAERIRGLGASFGPGTLDRLVSLIDGNHLGELAGEIDKLVTYATGRTVTVADVDELVSGAVQFQTWDLTDAVIEGRTDRALSVLRRMNAKDQPPQLLSYMLVRQFRQLMLAQALLREGMSAPQIGTQLGINSQFPLRKVIDQASRYPADRLEAAYRRLLESDVAVKTGVLDADTALEMLIVALTELAKAPRTTARAAAAARQRAGSR